MNRTFVPSILQMYDSFIQTDEQTDSECLCSLLHLALNLHRSFCASIIFLIAFSFSHFQTFHFNFSSKFRILSFLVFSFTFSDIVGECNYICEHDDWTLHSKSKTCFQIFRANLSFQESQSFCANFTMNITESRPVDLFLPSTLNLGSEK